MPGNIIQVKYLYVKKIILYMYYFVCCRPCIPYCIIKRSAKDIFFSYPLPAEGGQMKKTTKKAVAILLCITALFAALTTSVSAAEAKERGFPQGSSDISVYMNGERVLKGRSVLINSTTYVALRDFGNLVGGGEVSWDQRTRTAYIKKDGRTVSATASSYYIYADGRYFFTVEPILIIDDSMYVPIRPIAEAFGVEVGWDGATRSVTLKKTGKLPVSGSRFYDSSDLYWLARIISAEAKGEPFIGQIAVGNVVLNRVKSSAYPNTVYGVIFDKRGGTQFSPVSFGTIYQEPTASSVIAAKICLEGYTVSEDILFFMNPRIATSNWISKNRKFEFRIANHDFYS